MVESDTLPVPGPAEILRSVQKDEAFIQRIRQDVQELLLETLGQRIWLKCHDWVDPASSLIYYGLTNGAGLQTLGEEYAGIVQVDPTRRRVPSKARTAVMILANTVGLKMFRDLLHVLILNADFVRLPLSLNLSILNHGYQSRSSWTSAEIFIKEIFIPYTKRLHTLLFFVTGMFYHMSKRLTGVNYVLVRKWFANATPEKMRYIMWLSVLNFILGLVKDIIGVASRQEKTAVTSSVNTLPGSTSAVVKATLQGTKADEELCQKKCSLCLDIRRKSSLTPCGHLFCWSCILESLQSKEECPICREHVTPSRIVPLQNYI